MLARLLLAGALMAYSGAHNLGRFAWAGLPASATADDLAYGKSFGKQKLVTFGGGKWAIVGGADADTETALQRAGVVANDATDDADSLQAAIDSICLAGGRAQWHMPPGLNIRINSGLTLKLPTASFEWANTKLRCSGMTSGAAITATGQSVDPYNRYSAASALRGLVLDGPDTDSTTVDAIQFGDGATITGQSPIGDVAIVGFRDQLVFGANCYIQQLMNVTAKGAHRRGLSYLGMGNSGESIRLTACDISGAMNAGGTAVGIFTATGAQVQLVLDGGTSNDYCDLGFDINGGALIAYGAWFESSTNNPHGRCKYTGGNPGTMVKLDGCRVIHGVLGPNTEDAAGRPSLFVIDSSSGDRLTFVARGTKYEGYGRSATEFVTYSGSGHPKIVVDDHHMEQRGNAIGRPCDRTSLIRGTWATSGSDSYQDMPAVPGKCILLRMLVDSGLTPTCQFLDFAGSVISSETKTLPVTIGEAGTNALRSQVYRVPQGALSARLLVPTANVGAIRNTQAWVV